MREFLEDAIKHQDSGYGRAQKHAQKELPKRFYKKAEASEIEGGYTVLLDGRTIKTPGRKSVVVPGLKLAEALAVEWSAQQEKIDPDTMPLVRLVNTAVESGEEIIPAFREEIMKYAAGDLLYYRADSPRELVEEQERIWDEALVALARHFNVKFQPTTGIIHQEQPKPTLDTLGASLDGIDLFTATALVSITGLTGSGLLAIGLGRGLFEPEWVWQAAHVDEDHNARLWGEDPEAAKRRAKRKTEFDAAIQLRDLAR